MWINITAGMIAVSLTFPAQAKSFSISDLSPRIWQQPVDITARDLYYGPGGKEGLPRAPFSFIQEDLGGSSTKFAVKDSAGTHWKVKLGPEAQPETVATRLIWGVGYFADENYFFPRLQVLGMPAELHRGQELVSGDGLMVNARLERDFAGETKVDTWRWRKNPFYGTREFNGLRVMMALLNNWDLKDVNNAIYTEMNGGQRTYVVSDLGETFGAPGFVHPAFKARNHYPSYRNSKFITEITTEYVNFGNPRMPPLVRLFDLPDCIKRLRMRWIGRHIPRRDTQWIGNLLAQLSKRQIGEAFRAAGYTPSEVEAFSAVVQSRILALKEL